MARSGHARWPRDRGRRAVGCCQRAALEQGDGHRSRAERETDELAAGAAARRRGALPVPRLPGQEGAARAAVQDRPAGPRADLQAGRAGRVLLRPDLLDRLCHRGDAAGAGGRRHGGDRAGPPPGRRGRGAAVHPGPVLPAGDRRLPPGRRRLHGHPRQPGRDLRRRVRGRPAGRLRAHRGRERLGRDGRPVLGRARSGGPPGRDLGRLHHPADVGEPARCPRVGQDLRRPHLRLHPQPGRRGRARRLPGAVRPGRPGPLHPGRDPGAGRLSGSRWPWCRCSCCCTPTRPGRPP